MSTFSPRLMARLDAEIAAAPNPIAADCKRAERAGLFARHGKLEEAGAELDALRLRYGAGATSSSISAWLNFGESLRSHFTDMGPMARDKMMRAYALSAATGDRRLCGLSAAWLAQFEYLDAKFSSMAEKLRDSLDIGFELSDSQMLTRAALVAAQACHFAGDFELARPWYSLSRRHAELIGDESSVSAYMHNSAWIQAVNLRKDVFTGSLAAESNKFALMAAESAEAFDILARNSSINSSLYILKAQILSLQGFAQRALELYYVYIPLAESQGLHRQMGAVVADQAWCCEVLGCRERALEHAVNAAALLEMPGHCVDKAPGHSRLTQFFEQSGDDKKATTQRIKAVQAWAEYTNFQAEILRHVRFAKISLP